MDAALPRAMGAFRTRRRQRDTFPNLSGEGWDLISAPAPRIQRDGPTAHTCADQQPDHSPLAGISAHHGSTRRRQGA